MGMSKSVLIATDQSSYHGSWISMPTLQRSTDQMQNT